MEDVIQKSVRCCYSSRSLQSRLRSFSTKPTYLKEVDVKMVIMDFWQHSIAEVGDSYYLVILAYNNTEKTKYSIEFCGTALMTCDDYVCETLGSTSLISSNSLKVSESK